MQYSLYVLTCSIVELTMGSFFINVLQLEYYPIDQQ